MHFASCNSANVYNLLSEDKLSSEYAARQKAVIFGQNGLFITHLTFSFSENKASEISAIKGIQMQRSIFEDALFDYKKKKYLLQVLVSVLKLNVHFRKKSFKKCFPINFRVYYQFVGLQALKSINCLFHLHVQIVIS